MTDIYPLIRYRLVISQTLRTRVLYFVRFPSVPRCILLGSETASASTTTPHPPFFFLLLIIFMYYQVLRTLGETYTSRTCSNFERKHRFRCDICKGSYEFHEYLLCDAPCHLASKLSDAQVHLQARNCVYNTTGTVDCTKPKSELKSPTCTTWEHVPGLSEPRHPRRNIHSPSTTRGTTTLG